jgi:putative Mg2+ transporter-C (MgtC) family protein
MLVCLGATIASVIGMFLYLNLGLPTDISRLGAQVITGVSFLGAGTIIKTKKNTIKGLTTAAGLWTTAIVGLALGAGFYEGAIIATALVLVAETWFASLARFIPKLIDIEFLVRYEHREALDKVMRHFKDHRLYIKNLKVVSDDISAAEGDPVYIARVYTSGPHNTDKNKLIEPVRAMKGIREIEIVED